MPLAKTAQTKYYRTVLMVHMGDTERGCSNCRSASYLASPAREGPSARLFLALATLCTFALGAIAGGDSLKVAPSEVGLIPPVAQGPVSPEEAGKWLDRSVKLGDVSPSALEIEVFNLINQARANPGAFGYGYLTPAPPLHWNAALLHIAWVHSQDMATENYFNHDSYNLVGGQLVFDRSWVDRVRSQYPFNTNISENIAWNTSGSAQGIVQAWMDSQGHRENIMNISGIYTEGAIGVATGNGKTYWTHDFGGREISYNLEIANLAFNPSSPNPGDTVNVSFQINNLGQTDAFPVEVVVYRGNPHSGGTPLTNVYSMGQIVQSGVAYGLNGNLNTTGYPTDTEIYVWLDPNSRFAETNESDNLIHRVLFEGGGLLCDLNADGLVNGLDIFRFARGWCQNDPTCNLDGVGHVSAGDLLLFAGNWPTDH